MPQIIKKSHPGRKYYNLVFAILWGFVGVGYFFTEENKFLGVLYLMLSLGYIIFHIYNIKRGRNQDYVKWDDHVLEIGQAGVEQLRYPFEEIDSITITKNNLIIKSGAAAGTMVELKGFSEEDIETLKERFTSPEAA
ncbi:hypothetical protein L1I30_05035 [Gillisia sp. M10.2A]|uniref:YcxB-like C-terminal domain-containing protein n=1 Tax=Gillisia lutea TaxID=2909668 RepID=A0ABS9EDU2_9FLAO|nr:YcxB family protein [Gillisia lutea]MCF4101020.1 hypothetical protein [Gillisia lutea]